MKRYVRKGCKVFAVYLIDDNEKYNQLKIKDITILKYFENIFLEEFLELPPKRDIEFTIDLVWGEVLASRAPYWMNILYLTKLESQIHELIDKNYIRPSVSPWSTGMAL